MSSFSSIESLFLHKGGQYSKTLQFNTILLGIVVIYILVKTFPKTYGFIILLAFLLLYIGNIFVKYHDDKISDSNVKTLQKHKSLQNFADMYIQNRPFALDKKTDLGYLHNDAQMIHFLHSLLPVSEYNPSEFYLLLKATSQLLGLQQQIEDYYSVNNVPPQTTPQMFQDAILLKTAGLNNIHNLIYSLPPTKSMRNYLDEALTEYNLLITHNLDIIHSYYQKHLGSVVTSTSTKYVSYDKTKPFDALQNHPTVPSKNTVQNLPFYV